MSGAESRQGQSAELQQFLVEAIKKHVAESPLNRLRDIDGSPIWEEPLVGFANGDDPLFDQYKTVVGDFHLKPRDLLAGHLRAATGEEPPAFPHVGVISWVLPAAKPTKVSNRRRTDGPSLRWNHTRFQGEEFNDDLRRHVVALLEERGYKAAAPLIAKGYKVFVIDGVMISNWSERHAAYAAGLGTFSLSDGLITAKGIAHRVGNVIFNGEVLPSPRNYTDPKEYCPYLQDGSCGVCIERCPCGAITPAGHDKVKCREFLFVGQKKFGSRPGYIGHYAGCGLCQTKVPCESRIPRQTGVKRVRETSGVLVKE